MNLEELSSVISNVVSKAITKEVAPLREKLHELEVQFLKKDFTSLISDEIAKIPLPENGQDGKSVSVEDVKPMLEALVAELPKAQDGKSVSVEDVKPVLEALVAELPKAQDGKSVSLDDIMPDVRKMVSEFLEQIPLPENGQDGKSVSVEDVKPVLEALVAELPKAQDGKSVSLDDIMPDVRKMVSEFLSTIVIEDGEDGRDALDIDILPEINEEKSYPIGTYAKHRGGLFKAVSRTSGMKGWECIMEGIVNIEVEYDGQRKFVFKSETSGGAIFQKDFQIPVMIHQGVWKPGKYQKGDNVQLSGSIWICVEDTEDRPGEGSKSWQIGAKRGGTGDSAYDSARKAGFKGSKLEWLDSLGKKPTVKV